MWTDKLHIYNEIRAEVEHLESPSLPFRHKYEALSHLLERLCYEHTKDEPMQFPSFFARLVFLARKHRLAVSVENRLHKLRRSTLFLQKDERNRISQNEWRQARSALLAFVECLYLNRRPQETDDEHSPPPATTTSLPHSVRVCVVNHLPEKKQLMCKTDADNAELWVVNYAPNTEYDAVLSELWQGATLNLIAPRMDGQSGQVQAKHIVLEPDYLLDVSALAECFPGFGANYLHYFKRKFEPSETTHYMLLGNLANFFLDELIFAPQPQTLTFREVFVKAFRQMPIEFTGSKTIAEDADFKAFMAKAQGQFEHIRRVVCQDFAEVGIRHERCTLEPSFFCEKYGVQGRLDLLQRAAHDNDLYHIVELKSGGLPYPSSDHRRIAPNHEVQTNIYRMMVQTVFGIDARRVSAAILYSAAEAPGTNLRNAPPSVWWERQIIALRNRVVKMEHDMFVQGDEGVRHYLQACTDAQNYHRPPAFLAGQLQAMRQVFASATEVEQAYFLRFASFLARELYILKAGDLGADTKPGISDLWRSSFEQRKERYELIHSLTIARRSETERGMTLVFNKPGTDSQPFANFREGDICVVYPRSGDADSVLNNQIMKGTIARITATQVEVRFRYKQRNESYFTSHPTWAIEHDVTDHAYNQMFKNMFAFLQAPAHKRSLLLGNTMPRSSWQQTAVNEQDMEQKRSSVIDKAMCADDYFLIVGPPGTGKTSIFARTLIQRYYACPHTNILVMAYTNRAVDELCEAIRNAVPDDAEAYIRIGSELSCGEPYRHRLLQNLAEQVQSRQQLRTLLQSKRIFVGTLAAVLSRPELFTMKQFDVALIDEASQILEPQIVGLLPKFRKFILIGDHKQLSTITLQSEKQSEVQHPQLSQIHLVNCRNSLFERLFTLCQQRGWTHAYDTLTHQGRMHIHLAEFANKMFYNGMLLPANAWQSRNNLLPVDTQNTFKQILGTRRVAFLHTPKGEDECTGNKVNEAEAQTVALLAKALWQLYAETGKHFSAAHTLGIITPYRNQIATIRHRLTALGIPALAEVMVDTVERFQGSQRDVIFVSFCLNEPHQLQFFSNMNSDRTVDRKLNVALTRARQQMVLVGNKHILAKNDIYRRLLHWANQAPAP